MNNEQDKKQAGIVTHRFATVQLPIIAERIGKDWVSWGGDNLFPNFVIDLFNKSSINRRCIQAKTDALVGKGLITENPLKDYLLVKANPDESWSEVLEKVALDYVIHGGFAINVVWSRDGESISEIYHVDFSKVRSGKIEDSHDTVENFYYSFDWSKMRTYKPKKYVRFSPETAAEAAIEGCEEMLSQIFFYKDYQPNAAFYPLADYLSSMNDIQLDIQVSQFHNSHLANGMTPSLHISMMNGDPGQEAKRMLIDEITAAFAGAENGGRFFMTFADSKDTAPLITPLVASNDGYYMALSDRTVNSILTAHGITSPLLLGIKSGAEGFSSNAEEILTAWKHFEFTVIRPLRKPILKAFNKIFSYRTEEKLVVSIVPEVVFDGEEIVNNSKEATDTKIV